MSNNSTDDMIEALDSVSVKRGSGIDLGYLGDDDPNESEYEFTPLARPPSAEEYVEDPEVLRKLQRNTNQLVADFHNFLYYIDKDTKRDCELGATRDNEEAGDHQQPRSSGSHCGDRDEGKTIAASGGSGTCRPWARSDQEGDQEEDLRHNLAPLKMATIPEALSSSGDWPRYPGLDGYGSGRGKASRYRCRFSSSCQKYRGGAMASFCAIVLLVVVLSLTGKNKQPVQQELDGALSTQQDNLYKAISYPENPVWYDRSSGWDGKTYIDAEQFCSNIDQRWPCPYRIYCPQGEGKPPLGGFYPSWSWAPIANSQNEWIQLSRKDSCKLRSDLHGPWGNPYGGDFEVTTAVACCLRSPSVGPEQLTPNPATITAAEVDASPVNNLSDLQLIDSMTLTKRERAALDNMHPLWFGRKDGYQGTTHQEAEDFCNSVDGMQLCLAEAYCPNGSPKDGETNPQPLFLQTGAFPDEQWAALALNPNSWLLVGTIHGKPGHTCKTYDTVHHGAQPLWGLDGTSTDLKHHVLCCKVNNDDGGSAKADDEEEGPIHSSSSRMMRRGQSILLLIMVAINEVNSLIS